MSVRAWVGWCKRVATLGLVLALPSPALPLAHATTNNYDDRSLLELSVDTFGRSTTMDYDELDRLTLVDRTDAKGSSDAESVVRTYYPGGQIQTETNGLDHTTTFFLDDLNRVERTEDLLGLVSETKYDGNGNVTETIDRRGVTTVNKYDALNRLETVTVSGSFGPEQAVSTFGYDDVGNKLFETDVHNHRTGFEYDDLYRVATRTLPPTHTEIFTYDLVGNKKSETDANGERTQFEYDALNRLILLTDAQGNQFRFDYDESGNQTLEEDLTRGLKTESDYGELNELIEVRMADTGVFTYDYDPNRNRIKQTDAEGNTVEFSYDELNRLDLMLQDP